MNVSEQLVIPEVTIKAGFIYFINYYLISMFSWAFHFF